MLQNDLSYRIIGCAMEVHKELGPGLLESVYQECLEYEFFKQGFDFKSNSQIPFKYKELNWI